MTGTTGVVVWVVLALILVAVETFTVAFIGIYLAAGALCAAAVAAFDGARCGSSSSSSRSSRPQRSISHGPLSARAS